MEPFTTVNPHLFTINQLNPKSPKFTLVAVSKTLLNRYSTKISITRHQTAFDDILCGNGAQCVFTHVISSHISVFKEKRSVNAKLVQAQQDWVATPVINVFQFFGQRDDM